MGERQDYIALDWVAEEIGETLKQAAQTLEAYIANRDDATKLRFCLTYIHQVHGTLQMVEFFGAALLAEEMEGLAHALTQGKIHDSHIDDALLVLKNAIAQLPLYLERVKESRHGLPATLLPVLNDLRAVRGESLLSETVLFAPDMSGLTATEAPADTQFKEGQLEGGELAEVVHKLRQMFQIALLGLIRGNDVRKNVNYLAKVCARLVKLTTGCPSQALWRVCIAVLEGLLNGSIDASVAVKILLRQVDRQIKQIIDHGEAALQQPPPENLLKNLLYYVARSKANSRFIKEIKIEYNLDASLLGEGELEDETLATPDSSAMQSVVEALGQELKDINVALVEAGTDSATLTEVLPLFRRVCDTMAILGMGSTLKQVQEPYSRLAKNLATQNVIVVAEMDEISRQISAAEAALNSSDMIKSGGDQALFNDSEEAQQQLDNAFDSVVCESRNGLEQTKEAIIEFVATQWNHSCLSDVPGLLTEIRGSLNMVPLTAAADILQACEDYIAQVLLADKTVPEWQMLDTLADAITSIDYYLERLADDADADGSAILEVAAESVAELGYPVAIPSTGTSTKQHPVAEGTKEPPLLEAEPPVLDDQETQASADVPILAEVVPFQSPSEGDIPVLTEKPVDEEEIEPEVEQTVDAAVEEDAEDFDPEIVEIFIEEAGEVLEVIDEFLPQWIANISDEEASSTIRRAFHTLKGSGRMVGAVDISELAWSVEGMLNRVLDGSVDMDQARFDLVSETKNYVSELVDAFKHRKPVDKSLIEALIEQANALGKEQNPVFKESLAVEFAEPESETVSDDLPVLEDAVTEAPAPEDEEIDTELLEIFAAETGTHGQVLEEFIAHSRQLAGPAALTDKLQRALHTLKGSANMAAITPVAVIVTPIERLVKELRASQLKADQSVIDMLERGSLFIKAGVEQLGTTPLQTLPGTEEYIQQLTTLLKERMALAADQGEEDGGIPSEALNLFLTDSLDRIMTISEQLARWQQGELNALEMASLEQLTDQFIDQAESVNMLAPVELGQAMQVLYRRAASAGGGLLGDDFFTLAGRGNDTLIDMLDQIAGHQNPCFSQQLVSDIQDFEFDPLPAIEQLGTSEIELSSNALEGTDDGDNTLQMEAISDDDIDNNLVDILLEDEELLVDADVVELDLDAFIDTGTQATVVEEETVETVDDADIIAAMADLVDAIAESADQQDAIQPEPEPEPVASTGEAADADIDAEILEIFLEEADDLIEAIDESIHGWSDDRGSRTYLHDLLRILHTLKGGARLAGLTPLGNLSHNFETLLIGLEGQDAEVDDDTLNDIHSYQDQLIAQLAAIKAGEAVADVDEIEAPLVSVEEDITAKVTVEAASEESFDESFDIEALDVEVVEDAANVADFVSAQDEEPETAAIEPVAKKPAEVVPFTARRQPRHVSPDPVLSPAIVDPTMKKGPQEVVKVSAQLLEDLVNLAGETSISRGRAEEQISELVFSLDEMQITVDRLQEQVRRLDMETEQQILFRQEQVASEGLEEFDPLEMDRYSQLQQLSRSLLESSSDLIDIKSTLADKSRDMETLLVQQSRINTELQEGLMRSRMVPFSRMVPRLRRIIRQVSGELNKKVDFHLENVEGELDRTVLERMIAPLEHMLRNAVDHGIESAEQREAVGKARRGNVSLDLSRKGGEIVITLTDDGAGIDLDAVKRKAIERGLMEPNTDLSEHDILQFILQPGFSTAAEVTQISGRGVGMDVVHSEIKQLGGSMDIDSVPGQGSRFTVRLPFTVSINRALMVHVGGDSYAIPLNTIGGIVRVSPFELEAYYQPDAPMFEYAGQPYLLRYMGALLHRGSQPNLEGQSLPLPVVLVRGAEHSVALQVDSLMGSREIVVKPLGPQFSMVQGLSGATVLGDGRVVVILDLLALIRADASQIHRDFILTKDEAEAEDENRSVTVLVVDDSVTVRKVTSRFLERQGMEVILAKDGVDAITQLQEIERIPDVMLLDIEMPRMDGFEVASRVRHNSRLQDIPIIMITSRTGEKHRERALSLGVNKYMGKPFQEAELLKTINSLMGITTE